MRTEPSNKTMNERTTDEAKGERKYEKTSRIEKRASQGIAPNENKREKRDGDAWPSLYVNFSHIKPMGLCTLW